MGLVNAGWPRLPALGLPGWHRHKKLPTWPTEVGIKACRVDGSNDFNFLWLCHPGSLKTGNLGHPCGFRRAESMG